MAESKLTTPAKQAQATLNITQRTKSVGADKIFILKSIYKTKNRIQPAYDPTIGFYKGVRRLSEDDKKKETYFVTVDDKEGKNTTILLEDGMEINLNNEVDRINWEWMQHHPYIAMSYEESQHSPSAFFYVVQEGLESEKKNERTMRLHKALDYVVNDSPNNYYERAILLGHDLTDAPPATVQEFLLDTAKDSPEKILRIYEGHDLALRLLVVRAKMKNLLTYDGNVYVFGTTPLGVKDEHILDYLKSTKGKEIAEQLHAAVYTDK